MKKLTIASMTMAAIVGLTIPAQAQSQRQDQKTQATGQDANFISQAAQANLAAVELGKLGAKKSANNEIKQFSQHLETDHRVANSKLKPIAKYEGVQWPQRLDAAHKDELSQLRKLSGAEFDKQFTTMALKDHAKAIALFQQEAQMGQNQVTKQYAQNTLPALQHHLDMAKNVAKDVGLNETAISSILSQFPEAIGGTGSTTGQEQGTGTSQKGGEEKTDNHDHDSNK